MPWVFLRKTSKQWTTCSCIPCYYAENKIVKSLPEMIENATDAQLKSGLKAHFGETTSHVQRLEQVFQSDLPLLRPLADRLGIALEQIALSPSQQPQECR